MGSSQKKSTWSTATVVRRGLGLLTPRESSTLIKIVVAMVVAGLLEVAVLAAVAPLVYVISRPEGIAEQAWLSRLFSALSLDATLAAIPLLAAILVLMIVLQGVIAVMSTWWVERHGAECRNRLGHDLVTMCINAPMVWLATHNTSVLARQVYNDTRIWRVDFVQSLMMVVQTLILIVFPVSALLMIAATEGLIALAGVTVVCVVILAVSRRPIRQTARRMKDSNDRTVKGLMHLLLGIREVKVTNRDEYFVGHFDRSHSDVNFQNVKLKMWSVGSSTSIVTLGQIAFVGSAVILWATGQGGAAIVTQLALIGVVVSRVVPNFNRLVGLVNTLMGSFPFVEGLTQLVDDIRIANRELGPSEGGAPLSSQWSSLQFDSVGFIYPGARGPSLQNLTVTLERGKFYGVVGRSGAGKSTLVNLLLGLLRATEGRITIDGMDFADVSLRDWRAGVGYVPQDVFILDDTVRANIVFGRDEPDGDERLAAATRDAQLDQYIDSLPHGLDSPLGERGRRLSGGQAQRVAIARALYRRPQVLVLDEATSALDTVTERSFQRALAGAASDALVVAVAHRVSTLRDCDEILVLDHGHLVAKGSYEQLLKESQLFRVLAAQDDTEADVDAVVDPQSQAHP